MIRNPPGPHAGDRRPPAGGPSARGGAEAPPAKRPKTAKTTKKMEFTPAQREDATNAWVARGTHGRDFSALPPAQAFLNVVTKVEKEGKNAATVLAARLAKPRRDVGLAIRNAKRWANPQSALRKRHVNDQAKKAVACWIPDTPPPPGSVSMGDCFARVQKQPIERAEGKYDREESAVEVKDPGGSASAKHWAGAASIVDYTLYNHRETADESITLCTDQSKFVKHLDAKSVGGHMDEYALNGKVGPDALVHVGVRDLLQALDVRSSHVEGKQAGTGESVRVHLSQELSHAINSAYSRGARALSPSLSKAMPNYTREYEEAKRSPE